MHSTILRVLIMELGASILGGLQFLYAMIKKWTAQNCCYPKFSPFTESITDYILLSTLYHEEKTIIKLGFLGYWNSEGGGGLTCEVSGSDVGRPHRSGSHKIELLNANPETSIVWDRVPVAPAGFKSASVLYVTARAVPPLKSLENQPMTFEALHSGPSTTTFFSPADIVATGHVPNALHI